MCLQETLTSRAFEESSDLLILPWSETGSMGEAQTITRDSTKNKLVSILMGRRLLKTIWLLGFISETEIFSMLISRESFFS